MHTEWVIGALCTQHDAVAIIVRYGKVGAAAMDAAPSLKVISKHGSGSGTIDQQPVGANAPAVAEHAMALLLACAESVVALDNRMQQGHWDKASHKNFELVGRTVDALWKEPDVISLHCPLTPENAKMITSP